MFPDGVLVDIFRHLVDGNDYRCKHRQVMCVSRQWNQVYKQYYVRKGNPSDTLDMRGIDRQLSTILSLTDATNTPIHTLHVVYMKAACRHYWCIPRWIFNKYPQIAEDPAVMYVNCEHISRRSLPADLVLHAARAQSLNISTEYAGIYRELDDYIEIKSSTWSYADLSRELSWGIMAFIWSIIRRDEYVFRRWLGKFTEDHLLPLVPVLHLMKHRYHSKYIEAVDYLVQHIESAADVLSRVYIRGVPVHRKTIIPKHPYVHQCICREIAKYYSGPVYIMDFEFEGAVIHPWMINKELIVTNELKNLSLMVVNGLTPEPQKTPVDLYQEYLAKNTLLTPCENESGPQVGGILFDNS